jgi:hypothetical protein
MTRPHRLPTPALVLAADHRARGVVTVERYGDYVNALAQALPACDGILATAQPLADLAAAGHLTAAHHTYLSINRTGLATSAFGLDDRRWHRCRARLTGGPGSAATRIDMAGPLPPASTPGTVLGALSATRGADRAAGLAGAGGGATPTPSSSPP